MVLRVGTLGLRERESKVSFVISSTAHLRSQNPTWEDTEGTTVWRVTVTLILSHFLSFKISI